MADGHVVVVDLVVHHEALTEFLPMLYENARASLTLEPGCRRFDICQDREEPTRLLLYEIYQDAAAFSAHLATTHFQCFDRDTAEMVRSKAVRQFALKAG